jgi:hypothetical protein
MRLLARGAAILDRHTRLARLEAGTPFHAALGAAAGRRIVTIIHFQSIIYTWTKNHLEVDLFLRRIHT